jgi:hypothetical protein
VVQAVGTAAARSSRLLASYRELRIAGRAELAGLFDGFGTTG